MSKHETPLEIGTFAKLAGTVIANLPRELDPNLALEFSNNGDALALLFGETFTRENLNRALKTLGKPARELLLALVGTTTVAATMIPFVAREHFAVNTKRNAPVKISYLGDNFKEWFLGKTEEPFAGFALNYAKLLRSSVDGPIIAELGGEEKAETTLTEFFSLMKVQRDGQSGFLLNDGCANIFYVRDVNGILRAVSANWSDDGWTVNANPVTSPDEWYGGRRVFSRNSR